ncbi:MAG: hypothetical protein QGG64_25955 [Candidatus Latescibacteria bacterium]|jgi:hypothetical protein|nr:hypothetical protein [Candidatus Latescibacterota bacterium]
MRYYIAKVEEEHGEYETTCAFLIHAETTDRANCLLKSITKNWRDEGYEEEEGHYRHGVSISKMGGVWEIGQVIYDGIIESGALQELTEFGR